MHQAVGRERDADLAGLPLVPEQVRGRVLRLVIVDRGQVEQRGVQVEHAAAELAGQIQEPRQVERGRAETDLRPVVVLGDGRHDRQVLPGREPGGQAS